MLIARGVRGGWALVLLTVAAVMAVGVGGALYLAPPETRLYWALVGLLAATAAQALVVVWFLFKPLAARPDAGGTLTLGSVLRFVAPVALASGISLLAIRMDGFAVPALFGAAAKSQYLRGVTEPPVIGALAFTMLSLAAPSISTLHATGDRSGLVYLWRRTCRMVAVFTIPIVGMIEAVAEDLFTWVYTDTYLDAVPVFRWVTAGLTVRVFLPQVLMENTGAARMTTLVALANLALAALLMGVFFDAYGWVGAAPAMVLATLLANWLFGGAMVRAHLNVRWNDLLDWGHVLRLTLAAGAAWLSTWSVMRYGVFADLGRLLRIVVGCIMYAIAFVPSAAILRAVTKDEAREVWNAVFGRLRRLTGRGTAR